MIIISQNAEERWSTGTVHTFAKTHITSATIWRMSINSRFTSVNNNFPYLPTVKNPKKISVSRWWSEFQPKFNHLFTGPLPTFPENFMQIRLEGFAQSC